MRNSWLGVLVLGLVGCFDGIAPPALGGDGGDDMPVVVDPDLGPMRNPDGLTNCKTACDCNPGERCEQGVCTATTTPVYCCSSSTCPGSNICQQPDGKLNQCGQSPDAGINPQPDDGGIRAACVSDRCIMGVAGDTLCKLACGSNTAKCVPGTGPGNPEHCMP